MSQEQKIDYEIMQSLNCLLEFELQDSLQEKDFQTYKGKSKEVLSKLLVKLEDNAEYRKYLESEIKKLEELEKETQLQMAANEAREAERTKQVSLLIMPLNNTVSNVRPYFWPQLHNELNSKDLEIAQLKQRLQESENSFSAYKLMRQKEMQTVAMVCSALTKKLKALNVNFTSEEEGETGVEEDFSVALQSQ